MEMPNWLFEILFFGGLAVAIAWSILWRIAVFTAASDVYDAVTRKPEAHVETIQEAAERNIKARERVTRPVTQADLDARSQL